MILFGGKGSSRELEQQNTYSAGRINPLLLNTQKNIKRPILIAQAQRQTLGRTNCAGLSVYVQQRKEMSPPDISCINGQESEL